MGRTCAAPGFRTGYARKKNEEAGPKLSLFQAPKEPALLKKWQHSLPREDFKLSASSSLCELHFLAGDIENSYSAKGKYAPSDVTPLKSIKKRLKAGAVPVLWPGESYF